MKFSTFSLSLLRDNVISEYNKEYILGGIQAVLQEKYLFVNEVGYLMGSSEDFLVVKL